ncbi:MAG: RES family NAD+ phosphorylase [Salinibacter sp.]|uniref:RES family NAD+ phosphorylase n=1 Tax=Salinibacter sp. TaxID=2065818 RepID=UPI0035D474B4
MTRVWRIVKEKYADSAFSGEGARRAGGRFNSPDNPVVYSSESLALAELEILVNLPTDRLLSSYVAFRAEIPDSRVEALDHTKLPEGWREDPVPDSVRKIGDQWLKSERSLALRVPSAVVPAEDNILINPEHPAFEEVKIEGPFDPEIDDRLQ